MLFFTQVRPGNPPIKRNESRTIIYKQDKDLMYDLWSMNRVTVFYLYECIVDVSQKEVAPDVREEISRKMDKEVKNIQGVERLNIKI